MVNGSLGGYDTTERRYRIAFDRTAENGVAELPAQRGAAHVFIRRTGALLAAAALVVAMMPTPALAADSNSGSASATQSQQGGTPPSMPGGSQPGGSGGQGGGANTMTFDYTGSYAATLSANKTEQTSDGETIEATKKDKNAALAKNGGKLTITNGTLTKSGNETDGDKANFYGVNSILLAVGSKSQATISDSTLQAESQGSNGIFATNKATVYANNDTITTTSDNSRGLDATYGGKIYANKMTISTQGDHSAAIATDRGGGTISVTDSGLTTAGSGSPLLYSTGNIQVNNVTGTASGSQIAGMEGLNTILINNSTLESTQTKATASDPVADGIIIYQSTSGDAESTTGSAATFQAANSTLKSAIESGSMFYLTNTKANIVLSNTTLDFDSSKADLLNAAGNDSNGWGTAGSNGATVNFTGLGETLNGNISADTISKVNVYLLQGTTWTGKASITKNSSGSTSGSHMNVNVDSSSTWVVSANSTVNNLNVEDGGKVVDSNGNTVTIKAGGKTVVQGDSDITVTVKGSYGTTVKTSSKNQLKSKTVDRSTFDSTFGTTTSFTMGDSTDSSEADATDSDNADNADDADSSPTSGSILDNIVNWFRGLFD